MSRIQTFWGIGQGAIGPVEWLASMDNLVKIRDNDWDRLGEFEGRLAGKAKEWFEALPDSLRKVWSIVRELFAAYWIDRIGDKAFQAKCSKMLSSPSVIALVTEVSSQSTSFPIYHVLVEELDDPVEAFYTALEELQSATDTEKIFRILWDAAQVIGSNNCKCASNEFNRGFTMGKKSGIEEGKRLGLEEGRSFGMDEGRKLGFEAGQREGMEQAEKDRSNHMVSVAIDTADCALNPSYTTSAVQTLLSEVTYNSVAVSTEPLEHPKLNWAEEADRIPATVLIPPVQSARNISVLRSSEAPWHPFSSIQRRTRRSRCRSSHQKFSFKPATHIHSAPTETRSSPIITRRHPHGVGPNKPVQTFSISSPRSPSSCPHQSPLDWMGDPRLVQLGRILGELGWVRSEASFVDSQTVFRRRGRRLV